MKRFDPYIIIGVSLLLTSCYFHMSHNGDLDGFWQVRAVEDRQTNQTEDMRELQLSWAFQGDLLQIRYMLVTEFERELLFRFKHDGNELRIFDAHISNREEDDPPLTDISLLQLFRIDGVDVTYKILELDGSTLVLESDRYRLYLRHY